MKHCVKNFSSCHTAVASYVGTNPKQGPIISNNTMDLIYIIVTIMDPSKDGKENVMMMDTLSKFSVLIVTPNQ